MCYREKFNTFIQCLGFGSGLDPDSGPPWIRIRNPELDPAPGYKKHLNIRDLKIKTSKYQAFEGKKHINIRDLKIKTSKYQGFEDKKPLNIRDLKIKTSKYQAFEDKNI